MKNNSPSNDPLNLPGSGSVLTGTPRILVCLDLSRLSEVALSYAVMLARATSGSITLMNVIESSGNVSSGAHNALQWELKRHEARHYMEQQLKRIKRLNVPVDIQIEEGHAAEQILSFVRQHDIGFVILASHGSHGLAQWYLSSTAAKVIGHTNSSFVIVPATPDYQHTVQTSCVHRILLPLDDSSRALVALPLAVCIARQQHAELILAHAIEPPGFQHLSGMTNEDQKIVDAAASAMESVALDYFRQIADRLTAEGIKVSVVVEPRPSSVDLIYEIVTNRDIDLIVMSAHGSSGSEEFLFARTSTHLISHATVPLLVVQDLDQVQISRCLRQRRYDSLPPRSGTSTMVDAS